MLPTSPINQNPQPTQPFQVASKTGELAGKRYIPIDTAFLEEKTHTSLLAQGIIKPLSLVAYLGCMVVENSAWLVGGSIDIVTKEKNINALIDCALDVTTSVADEANRRSTLGGVAGMTTEVAAGAVGGTFGQLISWTTGKRDSGKRDPDLLETGGYVAGNLAGEQLGKGVTEGINRGITIGVTGLAGTLVPGAGIVGGAAANAIVKLSRNAIHGVITAPSNLTMYQVNLSAKLGYTVSPYLSYVGKLVSAVVNYTGQTASVAKEGIWDIYKRPISLGTSIARAVSPWSGWLMREWGDVELAKQITAFEQGKQHEAGRAISMEQFTSMLPQEQNSLLWLCQNTSRIPMSPTKAKTELKKLLDWQNAPANSKAKNRLKPFVEQLLRDYSKLSKAKQALLTPGSFKAMLPQDKLRFLKFIQEKGAYAKALTHQPQLQQQLEKISKETHYPVESKEYDLDALERLAVITFNYNYMGERSREFLDQFSPLSEAYLNNLTPEAKGDLLLAIMEKSSTHSYTATELGQMKFDEIFAAFNSTFSAAERFQILTLISNKSPLLFKSEVLELTEAEYLEIEKKIAEKILNGPALKPEEDQVHRKKLLQIEARAIVEARLDNLQKTAQKVSQKSPVSTPVDRQVVDRQIVEGKIQYDSGVPEQQAMGTFGKSIQWLFGSTGMVLGLMADIGASEKNPFTSPAVLVPLVHATATSLEIAGQFKFTQTLLATQLHKFPWVSQSVMAINNATIWSSTKFAAASNAALSYLLSKEESLHTKYLEPFFDQINKVADAKQTTDIEQLKKNGEKALLEMHQEFANGLPSGITLTPFGDFHKQNYEVAFKQAQESIEITEGLTDKKREALILQKTYATIATTMGSQLQMELTKGLQEIKEKQGVVGNTFNAFWGMFNLSQEQTATAAQEQLSQKMERSGVDMILTPKAGIKAETMLNEALETLETTKNSWTAYAEEKGAQFVGTLYTHIRDELRSDLEITNTALEYASSISANAATLTIGHQNLMLQGPQRLADSLKLKGEEYQRTAGSNWNSYFTKGAGFVAEKVGTALDIANGRFYVRVATRTAAQLIRILGVEAAYLVRPAFKNLSSFVKRSSQTIGGEVGELAEFLYGTAKDTLITTPNEQRIQNFLHLDPQERNYVIELVQVVFPEVISSTFLEKKDKSQEEESTFAKNLLTAFDKIGPGKQICMTPSLLTSRPPEIREAILKSFNLPATTDDLHLCRLLWKKDELTKRKFAQLTPEEFYALPKEEQKDLLFLATTSDAAMKTYDSISSWGIDYNGLCDSISKDKLEKILLLHTQIEVKDRRKLKPTTLLKFGPAKMREIRDLLQKTGNLDHLSEEQKKVLSYLDLPFDSASPDINRFQRQAVNYLCYLFNRRDWVSLQSAEKEAILTLSPAGIKELSNAEQLLLLQELLKAPEQSQQHADALKQAVTFLKQNLLDSVAKLSDIQVETIAKLKDIPVEAVAKLSDIQVEAISAAFNALPKKEKIALYDSQFSQRELLHLCLGMHATATTRTLEAYGKAGKSSHKDIKTKFKEKAESHLRAAQSLQSLIERTFFESTVLREADQATQQAIENQEAIEKFSYQILKQILAKFPANERLGAIDGKLQQNRKHLLQNPDNKLRLHLETETKLLEKIRLEIQPKSSIAPTSTLSPPSPVIGIVTKVRWWLRSLVSFSSDTIGRWGKELQNLSGSQAGGKMTIQVLKRANGLIASWQEGATTYHERFTLQKGFFGTTYLTSNRTGCTFSRPQELEEYLKKIEAPMSEKLILKTSTHTPTPAPLKGLLKSIRQIKREEGSLESVAQKYFLTRSGSTLMLERRVESGIGKPLQQLKRAIFHASYDVSQNLQLLQAENSMSKYHDDLDELVSQFAGAPFSRESLLAKITAYRSQAPLADKFYTEAAATSDIQKLTRFTHLLHRLAQDLTTLTTCEKNLFLLSNEEVKKTVSKEIRTQKEAILNQLNGITTDSIDNIEYPDLDLKGIETAILEDRLAQSSQFTTQIVKLETQFKQLLTHSPIISKSSPFFRPYRRLLSAPLRHLEEMKNCCMNKRQMSWKQRNRLESCDSFLAQYSQIVVDLQRIDESIGKIRTTIEQAQRPEKEETKYAFEERIKQLKTELHTAEKHYAKQLTSLFEGIDKGTKQIAPEEWHSKLQIDLSGLERFEGAVLRASRLANLDIAGMKEIQELLDPQKNHKVAKLAAPPGKDNKTKSAAKVTSDTNPTNGEVFLFAKGVADNITRWRFITGNKMHMVDSEKQLDIQPLINKFPTEKNVGAPLEQVAIRVVQKEIEALQTSLPALFQHELLQKTPLTMESLEYLELISQETHATLQAINQRLIPIFNMEKAAPNNQEDRFQEQFQEADVLANALTKLLLSTIESSPISPSKKKLLAGSIVATYKLTFQVDKTEYSKEDTSQNVHFFIKTINTLMSSIPEWESATATIDTTTTKPLNLLLKDMWARYILTYKGQPTAEGTQDPAKNNAVKVGAVINRAMGILQLQTGKNVVKAATATWILQKLSDLQLKGTAAEFEEWISISEKLLNTTDQETAYAELYQFHNELGLEIGRLGLLYGIEGTNDPETLTLLTHAQQIQLHFDQAIYKAHLTALNKPKPTHIPIIDAAKIQEEFIQYRDALKTAVEKRESDKSNERLLDAFLQKRYGRILQSSKENSTQGKIEALKQAIPSQKLQKKSVTASDLQALLTTTDTFITKQMELAQGHKPDDGDGFETQEAYIHALWTLDCIQILNSETLTPGLLALHLLATAEEVKIHTPLHTLLKWKNGRPTNKFSDLQAISLDVLRQTVEAIKAATTEAEAIKSSAILENTLLEFEKQSQLENSK